MSNREVFLTWAERLWGMAIGINILAIVLLFYPIGIFFFGLGLAPWPEACYDSGLLNGLMYAPWAIAIVSIFVLLSSSKSRKEGEPMQALLKAFFPSLTFLGVLVVFRLSPCWQFSLLPTPLNLILL